MLAVFLFPNLSNIAVEPRPLGRGYKALIFSLHDH